MDTTGHVKHTSADGISSVEFYHPRGNSMPGELLRSLATSIRAAHADPTSKVILLRSVGEGPFCAGASFDELKSIKDLDSGVRFFSGFAEVILAMIRGRKPVVARVHGKAVGGGVGVVAASDYTIATNGSALRLSEIALGIGPFTIGPVVERKIGPGAFSGAALSGDWRSADWGLQKGLYQDLCPTAEALEEAVGNLTSKLAGYSLEALSALKQCLWEGTEGWEQKLMERARISAELLLTPESQAAIRAVSTK